MKKEIMEFIKGLDTFEVVERYYLKKVRPEMITHDEISYHIDTLVSLDIYYDGGMKEYNFFRENTIETIGEELEVELEDFIDFESAPSGYIDALKKMKEIIYEIEIYKKTLRKNAS